MNTAILLAFYGSPHRGAETSFEAFRNRVAKAWPDLPRAEAHTRREGDVRRKLLELAENGAEAVAVQSLHVAAGSEYNGLKAVVRGMLAKGEGPGRMAVGRPLLPDGGNVPRVAEALVEAAPVPAGDEIVLLMGHGGRHPGNEVYDRLAEELARMDKGLVLGAMESGPGLDDALEEMKARGVARVILMPLLFAAGAHAHKDMSGPGPDSWKSTIENHGLACQAITKGLGEMEPLAAIWLEHLAEALETLKRG